MKASLAASATPLLQWTRCSSAAHSQAGCRIPMDARASSEPGGGLLSFVQLRSLVPASRLAPGSWNSEAQHYVAMTEYAVAHLEEIDDLNDGRAPFRPIRHKPGIRSFGVNTWTGHEVGDRIINEHDEEGWDEELYFVQSGRATFELDGERVDAPVGTFVSARPGVKRTAFAEEPGTTIIALGGVPGEAYQPHGWELWGPLTQLYQAGEYAEAAHRGRALLEENPQYPALFYNVACC